MASRCRIETRVALETCRYENVYAFSRDAYIPPPTRTGSVATFNTDVRSRSTARPYSQ